MFSSVCCLPRGTLWAEARRSIDNGWRQDEDLKEHSQVSFQSRIGVELQGDRRRTLPVAPQAACTTPEADELCLETSNRADERAAGATHKDVAWTRQKQSQMKATTGHSRRARLVVGCKLDTLGLMEKMGWRR